MSTSRDICHYVIEGMKNPEVLTEIVNDVVTEDSVVEHDVDVDFTMDGIVYNVNINVVLFGPEE